MEEIYIPKKVPRIEVKEKLHGHTTIDLFNTKTKKYERIEHDNTFTDALEKIFAFPSASISGSSYSPFSYAQSNYATLACRNVRPIIELLGGILLFDKELDATKHFAPAGVSMVANSGYGFSNSGSVTEFGSFNGVESAVTDNSASFVYDWLTSQGNGEISSVALTSRIGGYMGYGNATSKSSLNGLALYYSSGNNFTIYAPTNSRIAISNNHMYYISGYSVNNPSSVRIYKKPYAINELDVFAPPIDGGNATESVVINLPSTLSGTWYYKCAPTKTKPAQFMLAQDTSVANGSAFNLYFLDPVSETCTAVTITNTTGETMYPIYAYMIDDEYILLGNNSETGNRYKVKLADSTSAKVTKNVSFAYTRQMNDYHITPEHLGGRDTNPSNRLNIYDPVLNRTLPTNVVFGNTYNSAFYFPSGLFSMENDLYWLHTFMAGSYGDTTASCAANPLYLATVNNLDSPVTKTSDKTMKVTYTVTRSS